MQGWSGPDCTVPSCPLQCSSHGRCLAAGTIDGKARPGPSHGGALAGGECPLQNQAMSIGRPESRFTEDKRTFDKPINVSAQVLLDRERCVSCARCTRFADQIAGDSMLELLERGAQQQVGTADDEPLLFSYFSLK